MNNKKAAVIVTLFIVILLILIGLMAISGHIPFLRKPLTFIFALILILFIIGFFVIIIKRRK